MYAYIFVYTYSGKDFFRKMSLQLKFHKKLGSPVYEFYLLVFRGEILTALLKLIIRILSEV